MPSALSSPSGRIRSRTSDISDFLRGRHDTKTSMETPSRPPPSQIPAIPRLSPSATELALATPPKSKHKFSFLARKRKPSFSPSSVKADTSAASLAAAAAPSPVHANANSTAIGVRRELDRKQVPPVPVAPHDREGPSVRPPLQGNAQQRVQPQGPASGIPMLQSAATSSRLNGGPIPNIHFSPYGPTPNLVNNFRKQKPSLESTRRSSDSRASARPVITVSPPYTNIYEGERAYTAPRSAPLPSGQSSPERPPASLPTPTASERTTTPDSPTSVDASSPSTSTHSVVQLLQLADGNFPSATSYKEETLLRKNHFDVSSDAQPRRGTVSSANNKPAPATVGFPPSRTERRHISVMQLSRLKKEIAATVPKVRKMPSDSSALGGPRDVSPALGRSNTITISPPQSPEFNQSSPQPRPRAQTHSPPAQHKTGKRMPPPLKRTWHTPPTTGPPREPLPSPPVSATLTIPAPTTSDSSPNGPPSPSSSLRSRPTLPPVVPPKDVPPSSRAQGTTSPDSAASVNLSVPSSPVRSPVDTDTDRENSIPPSPRTPIREDLARKVLAHENATAQELRDALQQQVDKYKRLSSYLLSLTERHALERAELVHKVELLEHDRERREREMKGLKWLVAHSGRDEPARKDSDVMPPPKDNGVARDRSESAATSRTAASVVVTSTGTDGRMSLDSAVGSVEEGLVELQGSISDFIAPENELASQPPRAHGGVTRGPAAARRRARSNTVPNAIGGASALPCMHAPTSASRLAQKATRRTSSPVIPYSGSPGGFSQTRPLGVSPSGPRTGLGLGVGLDGAPSPTAISRSPSPDGRVDLHARSDSSTLSSLPSLSTMHSSSPSSGLSSIPETPRTDVAVLDDDLHAHLNVDGKEKAERGIDTNLHRLSTSSTSSFSSGTGSGVSAGSSRVSASPSIGQVLDRTKPKSSIPSRSHHQPEMEAILRRLRAFGQSQSP